MIYAMSDIHGQYDLFVKRVEQIRPLLVGNNKLVLLGDYIDRGDRSYECLKLAYDLEQELGRDKVIALKGNHEVWFEELLFLDEDVWLAEDKDFITSGSFLTDEQLKEAGVPAELIRISIGLEDIDDLIADLAQALEKC